MQTQRPIRRGKVILTDTNFETDTYGVTSKSQNLTILGQGRSNGHSLAGCI